MFRTEPLTRFAPTPSGYLHLGNAWSFWLTWMLARKQGGLIRLRIDDLDSERFRMEYLRDIFESLEWLGLDFDLGPINTEDFMGRYRQSRRLGLYGRALQQLGPSGADRLYGCSCSRSAVRAAEVAENMPGIYPGTCRAKGLNLATPGLGWRIRCEDGGKGRAPIFVQDELSGTKEFDAGRDLGDFVVRVKDGRPAYHLASVVDDSLYGIDVVVRGMDLLLSTAAQTLMAGILGADTFLSAKFYHHGLMVHRSGIKLSKSAGDVSLRSLREKLGSPAVVHRFFAGLMGLKGNGYTSPAAILASFDPLKIPRGPIFWEDFQEALG